MGGKNLVRTLISATGLVIPQKLHSMLISLVFSSFASSLPFFSAPVAIYTPLLLAATLSSDTQAMLIVALYSKPSSNFRAFWRAYLDY